MQSWDALADRINLRWLLSATLLVMGASLIVLATTPVREIAFISTFMFGVGTGGMLLLPNIAVTRLDPDHPARALLILGFCYGIGGIVGPQIVKFALDGGNFLSAYYLSGALTLALAVPFLFISIPSPTLSTTQNKGSEHHAKLPPIAMLLPFVLLIGIYVGTEVGIASWMFVHVQLVAGSTESMAAIAASAFWFGMTAGRGAASLIAGRLREEMLLRIAVLILVSALVGLVVFGRWELAAVICSFLAGAGCGPVFPTTMALVQRLFPRSFGTISGILLTAGSASVIVLPWLQGQIGGGRDGGMILPLFGALAILAILLLVVQRIREQEAASAAHLAPANPAYAENPDR
ncbi:MAG: MFS transporter [Anaerolineae bacterium]